MFNYHEAKYWKRLETFGRSESDENKLQCVLCPHECLISDGRTGICKVRKNIEGKLYSLNYGEVTSMALDPIEKKPLFHFYPGSSIISIGTWGCNFRCAFCQNWEISQQRPYYVKRIEPY
ncbi:MAG: AmmeMemoRadiSam system radical SAM enzyme, partial [Fervidobacterium nodosum]